MARIVNTDDGRLAVFQCTDAHADLGSLSTLRRSLGSELLMSDDMTVLTKLMKGGDRECAQQAADKLSRNTLLTNLGFLQIKAIAEEHQLQFTDNRPDDLAYRHCRAETFDDWQKVADMALVQGDQVIYSDAIIEMYNRRSISDEDRRTMLLTRYQVDPQRRSWLISELVGCDLDSIADAESFSAFYWTSSQLGSATNFCHAVKFFLNALK